jgi:hypothetical protein
MLIDSGGNYHRLTLAAPVLFSLCLSLSLAEIELARSVSRHARGYSLLFGTAPSQRKNRYVLYKERNMLLTELQLSRRRGLLFPQPERMKKVRKSMGAIRQVLGERKREKIAAFRRERQEQQQLEDAEMQFHE